MTGADLARSFLESVAGFTDEPKGGRPTAADRPTRLGVVDPGWNRSGFPRVLFDGESLMGVKGYPWVGVLPNPGERVVLVPQGRSYVIVGSIGRPPVVDYYKTPSAIALGGAGGSYTQNVTNVSYNDISSMRLTEIFLGDGDLSGHTDAAFEFILNIKNATSSAASSALFLGVSGGTTARDGLRSTYMQVGNGTGAPQVGGSATETSSAVINAATVAAFTGLVIQGRVHHALSAAERTKIEYTMVADYGGGTYVSGVIHNTSISVDDGFRFGSTATDRLLDGNIFVKRIN